MTDADDDADSRLSPDPFGRFVDDAIKGFFAQGGVRMTGSHVEHRPDGSTVLIIEGWGRNDFSPGYFEPFSPVTRDG